MRLQNACKDVSGVDMIVACTRKWRVDEGSYRNGSTTEVNSGTRLHLEHASAGSDGETLR